MTKTINTATVDQAVLSTSNGHSGMRDVLGSTSKGSQNGVTGPFRASGLLTAFAVGAMMDALLHTDFSIACCGCLYVSLTLFLDYHSSYQYCVEYNMIMYGWRNIVSHFVMPCEM
ncbi:hypothetical protein EV421DRAFT_719417 [Armillaria borealis]|uniref:Uncharacterized protein n=1 Tax=Armillaria borealis TaxID=47425 RepID=A0AA39K3M5_9AGAR|nr:hypothetical protein EV421DRAFT_719417 [Armillaria borealis]